MKDNLVKATHGSTDNPLRIGALEIPCYVLEDGRRVLYQRAMINALGMSRGSNKAVGRDRLGNFISGKAIEPFVSSDLLNVINNPIKFRTPKGSIAHGYDATVLVDICEAVLKARAEKALQKQQEHIAMQCEILVRGFARVGIITLVDEVTGYQRVRSRRALEEYLEKFISQELVKWVKTFPDEFYEEIYRLRNWDYQANAGRRPRVVGQYTIDLVYDRLAPFVLDELQRLTPKDSKGRRKHKLFQRLTDDVGHPKLREHLASVIVLMKASPNWNTFYRLLQRALPKYSEAATQLLLDLEEDEQAAW